MDYIADHYISIFIIWLKLLERIYSLLMNVAYLQQDTMVIHPERFMEADNIRIRMIVKI